MSNNDDRDQQPPYCLHLLFFNCNFDWSYIGNLFLLLIGFLHSVIESNFKMKNRSLNDRKKGKSNQVYLNLDRIKREWVERKVVTWSGTWSSCAPWCSYFLLFLFFGHSRRLARPHLRIQRSTAWNFSFGRALIVDWPSAGHPTIAIRLVRNKYPYSSE